MVSVTCGNCGEVFEEAAVSEGKNRPPCPACGSTMRRISQDISIPMQVLGSISIVSSVSVSSVQANVQSLTTVSDLLLQTVILSVNKKTEGRLVEAVAIPWFNIIDLLSKDPNIAYQIPPYKWEEIIAGSYSKAGFDEVILTPRSGDAGRDVIATIRGTGSIRVIDQVKAYKPGHLVTADDVRALYGVLNLDGAAKGFLTTTSDFAPLLTRDPLLGPIIPSRIELVNGKALLARLEELARKPRS
jgi:restriction system protein